MIVEVDADQMRSKVARCQHGCLLVCHWRPGGDGLPVGLCGLIVDDSVHQHSGDHARLLLLHLRAKVRAAPDGFVEILLRILWSQDQ